MVLHLDPNFKPVNGTDIAFKAFTFSGGEPHIKIEAFDTTQKVTVTQRVNSFNDFGLFLTAVDALRNMGVRHIEAVIPYFPAARQDRLMVPGEPLTVKVYATILNSLKLDKVYVFDAHSEVTPAVVERCEVIPNHEFIAEVLGQIPNVSQLVSPDGGALKKIYKVSAFLGGMEVTECSKNRDVKTGKLSGFKVFTDDLAGADCLVVDDICDGGATFIGLAEALKAKGAGKLYLAVSHGIFSKGTDSLTQIFDTVFTTNSFRNISGNKIVQLPIFLNY
ncbi:ribose-phosphate diphosphokinase [Flavobacterium selenitireducens]|uniref:ribose-phosphate diphosphokinase n=1 Tax=Flavobacterium selenitireducens TaxID=2722704 RepID=UPI00168B8FFE|nr:ribose-phosphate diphosphokinase [Flavobacterium selenitireducens]MBD3582551.1 ribose-phosphate pyrophosphokinase [Flavobacterium selenitireducens]